LGCEWVEALAGRIRNPHESSSLADALAGHIVSSLDNLSEAAQAAE
jgi:hypothetical protein